MVVVAGGVALGDGDTDGGVSVSGNSHWEELASHTLLACMYSCIGGGSRGAPGACAPSPLPEPRTEAMQTNVINMHYDCHCGLLLLAY